VKALPLKWRRAGQAALAAAAAALLTLGPTAPAEAQSTCLKVDYQSTTWTSGNGGGFMLTVTLTNTCDTPVDDWELRFTLPPGHTLQHGWSAEWTQDGDEVTATSPAWGQIRPGGSYSLGFIGQWSGTYQDPVGCTVDGVSCDGGSPDPTNDGPPTVTLTTSNSSIPPCPFVLAAEATDPDGIDRVEFYFNDRLVGTDDTYPYKVKLPSVPGQARATFFARAYDNGTPQLSGDSPVVVRDILIGDPVPGIILACESSVQVAAGTSEEVRFLVSAPPTDPVTLTVTGDPGVTVSPTSAVPEPGHPGGVLDVTVTADADAAGAVATITATSGTLQPGSLQVTVVPAQ